MAVVISEQTSQRDVVVKKKTEKKLEEEELHRLCRKKSENTCSEVMKDRSKKDHSAQRMVHECLKIAEERRFTLMFHFLFIACNVAGFSRIFRLLIIKRTAHALRWVKKLTHPIFKKEVVLDEKNQFIFDLMGFVIFYNCPLIIQFSVNDKCRVVFEIILCDVLLLWSYYYYSQLFLNKRHLISQ